MWIVKDEVLLISNISQISNGGNDDSIDQIIYSHFTENTKSDYLFYITSTEETDVFLNGISGGIKVSPEVVLAFSGNYSIYHADPSLTVVRQLTNFKHVGFGDGDKEFIVTSEVRDVYTLKIRAESVEDAIAKSDQVPVHFWNHPDIEPHLTNRKMLRMARWGNLTAVEVE